MRPVSDQFLYALAGSVQLTARLRPCSPLVRDGAGLMAPLTGPLPVLAGSVTLDGTADERMRVDGLQVAAYWPDTGQDRENASGYFDTTTTGVTALSRPGGAVWPATWDAPLTPFGTVALLEAGVELGGGNVEYVRLGYVRIDDMDQAEEPDGPISLGVRDLMALVTESTMVEEKTFATGTTYNSVFTQLLVPSSGWPGLPGGFTSADLDLDSTFAAITLPSALTTERDRYAVLRDLVADAGYAWYWDGRGKLVVTSADPGGDPVWRLIAGPLPDESGDPSPDHGPAARLFPAGRRISRDEVRTVVVADSTGLADDPTVHAVAWADGPDNSTAAIGTADYESATALYGFGPSIERIELTGATQAQADTAALARLAVRRRVPYARTLHHPVNAALEPGDTVRVWPRGLDNDPTDYEDLSVETCSFDLVPGGGPATTTATSEYPT